MIDLLTSLSSFLLPSIFVLLLLLLSRHRQLIRYGLQYVRVQYHIRRFVRAEDTTADIFAQRLAATPNHIAAIYESKVYTYATLDRLSNRIAQWALSEGLRPRDTVGLLMENSIEFVTTWLGLAKIGVAVALINTNLRGASLIHSIRACEIRHLIIGADNEQTIKTNLNTNPNGAKLNAGECVEAIESIREELNGIQLFIIHCNSAAPSTHSPLPSPSSSSTLSFSAPSSPLDDSWPFPSHYTNLTAILSTIPDHTNDYAKVRRKAGLTSTDLLFYIFTSGTTGLPKAAKVKHLRWAMTGIAFSIFFDVRSTDRIYCALPLYHTAGGMIGWSCAWFQGATVVLRRKFSASQFFKDCTQHQVTIIQYIGQLARYLLSTPPSIYDRSHQVRMAIGNGMGEDVWDAFQQRFQIEQICEFYGSTEGNANLVNPFNLKGVIGWIPPLAKLLYPVRIVQFDPFEEVPRRDPRTGFCIECQPGEVGELVSKIDPKDVLKGFAGYNNTKATNDKILKNVMKQGDQWFRSGDLVRADAGGYIRFVDRVGDTFRWKGENVATTEVANVVSTFKSTITTTALIEEVNVYGVHINGNEGRAGMATITLKPSDRIEEGVEPNFDFGGFYRFLQSQLPSYQQPIFLRFAKEIETTSTFKHRKVELVGEGFDPLRISDPIYFNDAQSRTFVRVDPQLYDEIQQGRRRI